MAGCFANLRHEKLLVLNLGGYLELAFEREFIGNSVGVEHAEGLLYVLDIIEVEEDIAVSIEAELLE